MKAPFLPPPSAAQKAARISAGLRHHHAAHGQSEAALKALAAARHLGPPARVRQAQDRLTDYAWLVSFGETREEAAKRVGVSTRTARLVYDRMLADQEAATRGEAA